MKLGRASLIVIIGILMIIFFFTALSYRIFLPHDLVFSGDWIKFTSNDAYYQMRLVDIIVNNFPHFARFDPYLIYPGGSAISSVQFFPWLIACIVWIIGLGHPTQHTIDIVGAYFPTILAALAVIPVFFIAKALFNRWAGVLAAALVAVLPGEFLGRSILGFTDHHIAETLFSTVAALFVVLAIKEGGQRQLTYIYFIKRDWKTIVRPLVYSLLAGIFLGTYLVTWEGGLLFVFIITLYFVIQFIINHLKHRPSDHLSIAGFISFLITIIIFMPISSDSNVSAALIVALLIPIFLSVISRLELGQKLKTFYYPATLIVIGVIFLFIFRAVAPDIFNVLWDKFRFVFAPGGATATTTLEMQPFLSPEGTFSTAVAWGNFTTSVILAPISFILLIYIFIRKRSHEEHWLFFLVWTLVVLIATLVQRRFAYYLAINIALLSAYLSWQAIWWAGARKLAATPQVVPEKEHPLPETPQKRNYYELLGVSRNASRKEIRIAFRKLAAQYQSEAKPSPEAQEKFKEISKAYEVLSNPDRRASYDGSRREATERKKLKGRPKQRTFSIYHFNVILAVIVVFWCFLYPNIIKAKDVASQARFAPSDAWQSSLLWMKFNTPEPFGNPDDYYKLYQIPPSGEGFKYPESAYGVAAWWDYGYWITRIAHRLPNTNPSQAPGPITSVAELFLSQDVSQTADIMARLKSFYIAADYESATSKFWAIVTWAGENQSDYFGVYAIHDKSGYTPVQLFYPKYYHTLIARLFNFSGQAVTEEKPVVITYNEVIGQDGNTYKQITDGKEFTSYQQAVDYVASQKSGKYDIVGTNPFVSPVALEAVPDFTSAFSSRYLVSTSDNRSTPEIKIFEYTPRK